MNTATNSNPDPSPFRLVVCVSGGGTTLQNLIDRIADGRLRAEIVGVVASRPGIGAIARAERAAIPVAVCVRGKRTVGEFSDDVFRFVREVRADLVVMGGFLSILAIPADFTDRVINVHPSLIPAFCGKGFHGEAVHRAAIETGVKLSGCTIHFADDTYDSGPIIIQRAVPVLDDDTPASLAARVFTAECDALPEAITLAAEGRLKIVGHQVRILSELPH
jgi:phosphoribosylglycinamide formyltransferase-1